MNSQSSISQSSTSQSSSISKSINLIYQGLKDGGNIISLFKLIKRSSRIQSSIKEILPLYSIFSLINLMIFFFMKSTVYVTLSLIARCAVYSLFLILFTSLWVYSSYETYKWYLRLWNSVYSKKDEAVLKTKSNSKFEEFENLVHGMLLSLMFTLQAQTLNFMISRILSSWAGIIANVFYTSLLISWNSFEYRLIYEGLDIFQRKYYFERRWLYFLGYGLPLSIVYVLIFNQSWKLGVCVWYPGLMFMTIRAIRSKPSKFERESTPILEDKKEIEYTFADDSDIPRRMEEKENDSISLLRKRNVIDPYYIRLQIFWIPMFITKFLIRKFVELTPLKRVK